jgi:hypothetical protein
MATLIPTGLRTTEVGEFYFPAFKAESGDVIALTNAKCINLRRAVEKARFLLRKMYPEYEVAE